MKNHFHKLAALGSVLGLFAMSTLVLAAAPTGTFTASTATTLTAGGGSTAIGTLTITEDSNEFNATDDLYIRIPSGVNATWDTAITTPTLTPGGGGSLAVDATVSYTGSDKILVVNITDVSAGIDSEFLTISGLQMIPDATLASSATALDWSVDAGAAYSAGDATTEITVDANLSGTPTTTTSIGNQSPVMVSSVVDDSDGTAPTNAGSDVTFTGEAHDINGENYFMIVCAAGDTVNETNPPTCSGTTIAVSASTASDAIATATVTTSAGDAESIDWEAYYCDDTATPSCYPADAMTGNETANMQISAIPDDGETIVIETATSGGTVTIEFDTNASTTGGNIAVDISSAQSEAEVAALVEAAVSGTPGIELDARGDILYLYEPTPATSFATLTACLSCALNGPFAVTSELAAPYKVNHAATFSAVTIEDTDSNDPALPEGTLRITVTDAVDTDVDTNQDLLQLHVCSGDASMGGVTTSFDYATDTCNDGTLLCSSVLTDTTLPADLTCDDLTGVLGAPVAHGSYDLQVYVEDEHGFAATDTSGNSNVRSFDVADVAPELSGYDTLGSLTIPAGGSTVLPSTIDLIDLNGDLDVTASSLTFYASSLGTAASCGADEQNCYVTTCTLGDQSTAGTGKDATGTDVALTATCEHTVYFNALDGDWDIAASASDGQGATDLPVAGLAITVPALLGLNMDIASIDYGALIAGEVSSSITAPTQNMGNQVLDLFVSGSLMCPDYPACASDNIAQDQQKWSTAFSDMSYQNEGFELVLTGSEIPGVETDGCSNMDLAVRTDHTSNGLDENVYFKLQAPSVPPNTYTGANTFTAAPDIVCTGTE